MLFVPSMTERRAGLPVDRFAVERGGREAVADLSRGGHTLCEYMHNSALTKCFLDRDVLLDSADPPSAEAVQSHKRAVIEKVNEIAFLVNKPNYVLASRHGVTRAGRFKVSFRVFFKDFKVVYHAIPVLIRFAEQADFWDTSPYKASEQLLGAINGAKGRGDARVLAPEPEYADRPLLDFVAQFVEPDWPLLDLQAFAAREPRSPEGARGTALPDFSLPDDHIRNLVSLLSSDRATDRKAWVDVGTLLKTLGGGEGQGQGQGQGGDADRFYGDYALFSARATDPCVVCSDRELSRHWRSLGRGAAPNPLTVRSLVHWARSDSPDGFRALVALPSFAFRPIVPSGDANTVQLINRVRQLVPGIRLGDDTPAEIADESIVLKGDGGGVVCDIDIRTFAVTVNGEYKGMICGPAVPVNTHLANVNKKLVPSFDRYVFSRDDFDRGTITSVRDGIKMDLHSPFTDAAVLTVNLDSPTRESFVVNSKACMRALQETILKAIRAHGERELGGCIQLFNNCTFVVNTNFGAPEDDKKNDEQITRIIIDSDPGYFERWRFVPEMKSANCNGLYFCDPETNIWRQLPNSFMEKALLERVPDDKFTPAELRHIKSRRGRGDMLYTVGQCCMDLGFTKRLDSDKTLFVMDNCLLDTKIMAIRDIREDDFVSATVGWSYDADLAARHREEVETFFGQIWPVAEERRVALGFFASSLTGHRGSKKFAVFSDHRRGNNGKSTVIKAFLDFFENLSMKKTEFFLSASFAKSRDSHNAGMKSAMNKRLIVGDEFEKHQVLDVSFMKDATGGRNTRIEGRNLGSAEDFKFIWEANMVLAFNEDCCPKFDADPALLSRMITVPFRSKFLPEIPEDPEENTFVKDGDLPNKFPEWRSAVLDILMENFGVDLDNIPPGMKEWKRALAADSNPFSDFLSEHLEFTGAAGDWITVNKHIEPLFDALAPNITSRYTKKEFKRLAIEFLRSTALDFKEKDRVDKEGVKTWVREGGIARGVIRRP
eukprot:jgi/Tetstr1/447176/TSEL_034613.t1